MKLIIQIPCLNEAETLATTLSQLPRQVEGFDDVEWLVINDGSTDETVNIAYENGVDHVIGFTRNQGLAKCFTTGLDACLKLGADVIVNTDADNQYSARNIQGLVKPILEGNADIVIGARSMNAIDHFSGLKKLLQRIGSWAVRVISKTDVPDAPSGFRALSREAALRLNVFSEYTYTLETIIQAGQKNMAITWVPVDTNPCLRPSRLLKNVACYMGKSINTMIRVFVVYKPFRFFLSIGSVLFASGFLVALRFIYFFVGGHGSGHIQSLILASILLGIGFQTILVAFLSDLLAVNRRLMEDLQYRTKKMESGRSEFTRSLGACNLKDENRIAE